VYASHLSAHAGVAHFVENGCRRRAIVGSFVHDIQHDTPLGLGNTGVFEEVVDKNLKRLSIFQRRTAHWQVNTDIIELESLALV
jgi:hypothetical protein